MADLIINSLRGGMNNSDPSIALPDDQVVLAKNVEFNQSMLGERRYGTDGINLPSSILSHDMVTFLHRHTPGTDSTAKELWVLGLTGTSSSTLARKTSSWSDVTVIDTPNLTGFAPYQWTAVSLHGKIFIAFDSSVDRLHVVDSGSTTMRRVGLDEPAAPTGANDGGVGTFTGTRYYRVRYTVKSGSTILRRSEPSEVLTFTPNGNDTGITVTKPASISEGETHWELEASVDNANFYVIAETAVGTTTVTDTTEYRTGYAITYELSEDIGDYALIPSGRFLVVDEDRLVILGSWEDNALASRATWTPVENAPGVGNDERIETDTDPVIDLDGQDGGGIVGAANALGTIWVFKNKGIYKLIRSGLRNRAYDVVCVSKVLGAVPGSVAAGTDQMGRPCVYFIDPDQGPQRAGVGGIKSCGNDIQDTWETVNLDASQVVCSCLYYPKNRQMIWNVATGVNNTPDTSLVLQTSNTIDVPEGVRKGWSIWDGTRSEALAMCLFSDNINDNTTRNHTLRPFIGLAHATPVHICDTGNTDDGDEYEARIVTRPYILKSLLYHFVVHRAVLLAKKVVGSMITMRLIRDFGVEEAKSVDEIKFEAENPLTNETDKICNIDNFSGSELRVAQFEFIDTAPAGERWELNQLAVYETQDGGT